MLEITGFSSLIIMFLLNSSVDRGVEKELREKGKGGMHGEKEGRDRGEEFIWPGL